MVPEKLQLVVYPNPLLKKRTQEVQDFDDQLKHRIREMFRIMYENKGIGLAGNQAGLDQRIIVMNLSGDPENEDEELVIINPQITNASTAKIVDQEGCLSFPELKVEVERNESLTFSCFDETQTKLVFEAEGIFARCLQHELDHLNGITFVDRLTPLQRASIQDQLHLLEQGTQPHRS